ncbi:MAG: PDZ domain-containing protein [Bacteroidota bacterium]
MKQRFSYIIIAAIVLFCLAPASGYGQSSKKGFLGVYSQTVTRDIIKKYNLPVDGGAYINGIVDGSAADDAGLRRKDVIVKFGDAVIEDDADLTDAIRHTKPYTEVTIELYRNGEKKTLTAKVDRLKSSEFSSDANFDFNWIGDIFSHHTWHSFPPRGVTFQNLTGQLGDFLGVPDGRGVLITEVRKGGVIDKAGFKAGDVITKIDNRETEDINEITRAFGDREGKNVPVEIVRSGKPMTLNIQVPEEEDDWY